MRIDMLPEISLNVLDIAQNSITAKAQDIRVRIETDAAAHTLAFTIRDNGCGMTPEQLAAVTDPFFTTRTTRKVGLGVPFLKQAAELSGGSFVIESAPGEGTFMQAVFRTDSVDCMPLGDITATMHTLIVYNEQVHFVYTYAADGHAFTLDTDEFREILGDISFQEAEISAYILQYLTENKAEADAAAEAGS